jgi:protease-4
MPVAQPAAALQAQHELASLAELSAGRKPYAALVHCLCTAP